MKANLREERMFKERIEEKIEEMNTNRKMIIGEEMNTEDKMITTDDKMMTTKGKMIIEDKRSIQEETRTETIGERQAREMIIEEDESFVFISLAYCESSNQTAFNRIEIQMYQNVYQ